MYQKTVVIGHLGRDPEMRYTPSGVPVTNFSVATTRKWKNADGEPNERTTWYRVTCWRKLAELTAQYLQKGRLVLVEGDIEASAWSDKQGEARASLELTATNVRFLGGSNNAAPNGDAPSAGFPPDDADIPF